MPSTPAELPSDVAALRATVAAQAAELAAQNAALAAQDVELAAARAGIVEQRFEIEALKVRLARALRVAFGRSSEKLRERVEQLELTLADIDELLAETAPSDDPGVEPEAPVEASKPVRRRLSEALPRDVVEHAAPCHDMTGACLACGGMLRRLGEDVTELLDYVPGSFVEVLT